MWRGASVPLLNNRSRIETPCYGNGSPVIFRPRGTVYFRLTDHLQVFALDLDGNGQPLHSQGGLYSVSVAPVTARILQSS